MIVPAKHLDLNTCVLRAASRLLVRLRQDRVCRFVELQSCLADLGEDAEIVFFPTINFLYLLGRVEYHPQTDSFEYLQHGMGVAP